MAVRSQDQIFAVAVVLAWLAVFGVAISRTIGF